jgi:hypothetical protein
VGGGHQAAAVRRHRPYRRRAKHRGVSNDAVYSSALENGDRQRQTHRRLASRFAGLKRPNGDTRAADTIDPTYELAAMTIKHVHGGAGAQTQDSP